MVEVTITSIGFFLCFFGVSLIIFLLLPRQQRETTVPGPDRPESNEIFKEKLAEKGFATFLRNLHEKFGGQTAFYLNNKIVFSIEDEEVISSMQTLPIPVIENYKNFSCLSKSMERQRFRQVRKWFEGTGKSFIEQSAILACNELNSIWKSKEINDKGAQHVGGLSMQIAARACCGITDRNHLTSLKQSADEIANLMNKDYLENNQTELENALFDFESKLSSIKSDIDGSLRSAVENAASNFLLSSYWTYNLSISALLTTPESDKNDIIKTLSALEPLPWLCSLQDAGLSILIGDHSIPNDAVVLTFYSKTNLNLDCWSQYPVGLFSLCSMDPTLWCDDISIILKMLTRGLSLTVSDENVKTDGKFLKIPTDFTIKNLVQ